MNLLLRRQGSNTRETIDNLFKTHNFQSNRVVEFDTNEAIKQATIKGKGVAFLSENVIKNEVEMQLLVPLILDQKCQRKFSLISPKGKFPSPILLIFNSFLKKNIYKID